MPENYEKAVSQALQNSAQVAVALCEPETYRFLYCNTSFSDWFGATKSPFLQDTIPTVKLERLKAKLAKNKPYAVEYELKKANRSRLYKINFSKTEAGLVLLNAQDYTKEKEVEYMLDSYIKMAEKNKKELEASLQTIKEQKNQLEVAYANLERERNTVELRALQAVINPHFVSNCLASIQRFVLDNNTELSVNYLSYFGRLMRMNFEQSYNDYIALGDIIRLLETYVEIERIRIGHEWEFLMKVDPKLDVENIKIPPLLIQPFVENAIWHGINHKPIGGKVSVQFVLVDEITLKCSIMDNGPGRNQMGFSNKSKKHALHSLNVTNKRLDILWAERDQQKGIAYNDLVDDLGRPIGTKVELYIPIDF